MNKYSAALLAGGKSTRMGRDKCLIEIDEEPVWQRQTRVLRSVADEVFVVAPILPDWCPHDLTWLPDVKKDVGPLAGLAAALEAASYSRVVLLAVDLPGMTDTYLDFLKSKTTEECGIVPEWNGFFQPLCAIYPRGILPSVLNHLEQRDKSFQRLIRDLVSLGQMIVQPVDHTERDLFRNLNSPED